MSEFLKPEVLTIQDEAGHEVDITQGDFWQYEDDARRDVVYWDQLPQSEFPELTYDNQIGER